MRFPWRGRVALLLGSLSVAAAAMNAVQTLTDKRRNECTLESQRLYHCASYSATDTILTDKQKKLCCDAIQTFNWSGCFCGWGRAADMNPWTRDVLSDLASAYYKCSAGSIPCMADEEYLQSSDTGRGYGGPEMQALKTATSAVSKMVNEDGWSIPAPKLPGGIASTVQSLLGFRQADDVEKSRTGSAEAYAGEFDIAVKVEQEGGDEEDMSATVRQLSRWISTLLDRAHISAAYSDRSGFFGRGSAANPGSAEDLDRMDRTDTLGSVLAHVMDLISSLVNGTDAQVDVAVEITIETTTTTSGGAVEQKPTLAITKTDPLIHRAVIANPSDSPRGMRIERIASETVAGSGERMHGERPHCLLQRIARAAAANPMKLAAILAATAFLFLLGAFIAQVVCAIVCEVQRQMIHLDEEDPMTTRNPLLHQDLTAPLLGADGELYEVYSRRQPETS